MTVRLQVVRPFLLRRLKSDVEKGLPPKKETILKIGMSEMQKKYYAALLQKVSTRHPCAPAQALPSVQAAPSRVTYGMSHCSGAYSIAAPRQAALKRTARMTQ